MDIINEGYVHCPHCKGVNTYQKSVEVFLRDEDSPKVMRAVVGSGPRNGYAAHPIEKVFTEVCDNILARNPSSRRYGMRIIFGCEMCTTHQNKHFAITFAQHKGSTEFRVEMEA